MHSSIWLYYEFILYILDQRSTESFFFNISILNVSALTQTLLVHSLIEIFWKLCLIWVWSISFHRLIYNILLLMILTIQLFSFFNWCRSLVLYNLFLRSGMIHLVLESICATHLKDVCVLLYWLVNFFHYFRNIAFLWILIAQVYCLRILLMVYLWSIYWWTLEFHLPFPHILVSNEVAWISFCLSLLRCNL